MVTDRTAPGEAPDVAGRTLTPAGADLTVLAVAGRAQQRSVPAIWYVGLGAAWSGYVATAVLLPLLLGLVASRRRRARETTRSPSATELKCFATAWVHC